MDPIITGSLITAGAGLLGNFMGKKKTRQEPLETPEQRAARQALLGFSQTGKFGDFQAGAEVPLGYGDYGVTGLEQQGQSALQRLLGGGIPEQYRLGDAAIRDFLDTSPEALDAQFRPVQDLVARRTREANDALKREAAFAGNLYSTDTIRRLGDIEARGTETLTSELARLTNQALERKMQAIPLAMSSAQAQEAQELNRIAASQQYGGLTRALNDASIKARDAELLRRRQELQLPIQAAQTVAGGAPQFGVPEVETSPYQDLLNMVGQVGGRFIGNEIGLRQYKRLFPGTSPAVVQ